MVNFSNKYSPDAKENYKPFLRNFIILVSVGFMLTSIIFIFIDYREQKNLIIQEESEDLEMLVSMLHDMDQTQNKLMLDFLDVWLKSHAELIKITLIDSNGKTIKEAVKKNKENKTTTLKLSQEINLKNLNNALLIEEVNVNHHLNRIICVSIGFLGLSFILILIFGIVMFRVIHNYAISPLQKKALKEFNTLKTIIDNLQVGIALIDADMNLIKANALCENWFSDIHEKSECKKCYSCLNPESDHDCHDCPVTKTFKDGKVHEANRSFFRNGEMVYQRVQSCPIIFENKITEVIEIVEDISAKVREQEIYKRSYRVQKILLQCMQALIHSDNEEIMLQKICQIIVDSGYYKLAWIGFSNFSEKTIELVASAGFDEGFIDEIKNIEDESEYLDFPVTRAIKTKNPQIIQDIQRDSASIVWKKASMKSGFKSMLSIPVDVLGSLNIFAEQKNIFDEEEINFLTKLAGETSYGIQNFRNRMTSKELMEVNIALKKARDEADTANRKKSDFLAVMTHEIRTPLAGILGISELLASTPLSPDQQKYISIIKSTGDMQLNIINDILDLSKIEKGKLMLDRSEFDLRQLIDNVIQTFQWQIQKKDLTIIFNISPEIPEILTGDPLRIRQILFNLIGNSIKFTDAGGIAVFVEKKYLDSLVCKIKFSIIDTGIGIPEDKQSGIFESYNQADITITKEFGGTGLGTTISKNLVELMGGTIGLISPARKISELNYPNKPGTEFWFILELSVLNIVETAKPEKTSSISMIPKSSEHAKILVAEDNEISQMLIKIMLEKLNHKVEIAKNGKIAIEMATANSYDLIFMDIELPELKGDEAARILKFEKNINIPIVALTANSISENIRRYLKNGLDDCLLKPYKQEELEAMIIKWLGYK